MLSAEIEIHKIDSRLQFANDHLDEIVSSANRPFDNMTTAWWLDSDEPWQTLAACNEIRDAMASPRPEEFVSHLPIHQVPHFLPGANPTIASYNASVVNFYNTTGSLARFENKKYYLLFKKTL
jgi:hypothetical protein